MSTQNLILADQQKHHQQNQQMVSINYEPGSSQSIPSDASQKTNFVMTSMTIIKMAIGSGILVMPYTANKCGLIFFVLVFAAAIALSQFSTIILLKAKDISGHSSYSTILYHVLQSRFSKAFPSIFLMLANMGVCIAEIIIFKKTILKILNDLLPDSSILDEFYTNQAFIAFAMVLLQIPFIWVKRIERLKNMAVAGVIGLLVFTLSFLTHYGMASNSSTIIETPKGGMTMFPQNWVSAIATIPNIIYALAYFANFFPIYKGMRVQTNQRMKSVALVSMATCSVVYIVLGILGYNLIGNGVKGNLLESIAYSHTNGFLYFSINCGFLLSICFTFPLVFFASKINFIVIINCLLNHSDAAANHQEQCRCIKASKVTQASQQRQEMRNNIKICILFLMVVGVGVFAEDITVVFNAVGGICSTSNMFFLPCSFYILLLRKEGKRDIYFYIASSIFVVMAPFSVFTIIAKYIHI